MFESIDDVPFKLVEFYTEDEDGLLVLTTRPSIRAIDNVDAGFIHGSSPEAINTLLAEANESNRWKFFDDYIKWVEEEPKETDTAFLVPLDKEGNPQYPNFFEETHQAWLDNEPTEPVVKVLTDYPNYQTWLKLQGIMFEGIRCSATKEDMWGLNAVSPLVKSGTSLKFHFDSGDTLVLTPENIEAFEATWVPFRLQFFN